MILSICIPTYNRGKAAYSRVEELLPYCERSKGEVELVISDNGSERQTEEYEKIAKIQSDALRYFRADENKMFYGNLRQVIKLSNGDFCLIVSDEDAIRLDSLDAYLELLKKHKDHLSMMKGYVDVFYEFSESKVMQPGIEATREFFLTGNYVSGAFYNRSVLTDNVLDFFWDRYRDVSAYQYYPHLMYEAYLLQAGICITCALPLIHTGNPDEIQMTNEEKETANLTGVPYNTIEARIEQMIGYILLLGDLPISDIKQKLEMCSMILNKTWTLIGLMKNHYIQAGEDWTKTLDNAERLMSEILEEPDYRIVFREQNPYILDTCKDFLLESVHDFKAMVLK